MMKSKSQRHYKKLADGVPVAPSMSDTLETIQHSSQSTQINIRVVFLSAVAICIGGASALAAEVLTLLIGFITNLAFYGRFSTDFSSPADNNLGWGVILIPMIGGLIVGLMARYGAQAIRGHGIPEAMEQVLRNRSRIAPRLTFLKPASSAIAIGTGGPFGAEGPIIATGGALGSLVGQLLRTTANERKTLLAAGASAGMAAIFGSPISAVILAVELLLFEFRARSIVPVALAAVTATGIRYATTGATPVFAMPEIAQPGTDALIFYILLGAAIGIVSVLVTRLVYGVEDLFERLPVHWMWWPALGGLAVGMVGFFVPETLGVGYENIEHIVSGQLAGGSLILLCVMKLVSWVIALGSGTSGGTLAPLFTIGGGIGAVLGAMAISLLPQSGIDVRIAGLVGMAAIFAGSSRALLASVIFAFETTLEPAGLLPLLGGCTAAYMVSSLVMRQTIMTEKIARRGIHVPSDYTADFLEQVSVRDVASTSVTWLHADDTLKSVVARFTSDQPHYHGYPILDAEMRICGLVTLRDLLASSNSGNARIIDLVRRPPVIIHEHHSLRAAADHMVREGVGRLIVVSSEAPQKMVGIVTRGDLLSAHRTRLHDTYQVERSISMPQMWRSRRRVTRTDV